MLDDLGLDARTQTVYEVMLTHRDWGVSQIARHLSLTDDQLRTALDRLVELRLLRRSLENPGALRPVSPEVGLQSLLHDRQADLLRRQEEFARNQATVTRLISEYTSSRDQAPRHDIERLDGLDAVYARLEALAAATTSECLALMPGGAQSAASLAASQPLDEQILRRGGSVLTVYLASVRNDLATHNYARWLTSLGGQVRTTPTLPVRMVLFDRQTALVPLDPDNTRQGAVQLTGPGFITALAALFEQIWSIATPFGQEHDRADGQPTPEESELLQMLAQGLTDEVAARRLGLSLRTVRRMMASLMRRLGATSRFEAGLRAAKRGWIKP